MAPSAISPRSSPQLLAAPVKPGKLAASTPDSKPQWQRDLETNGYAVVKQAIPRDRAEAYRQKAWDWLKSFDNEELDFKNPTTWIKENLPVQSSINTFKGYGVAHEKFMWDAKQEQGVLDAFAQIWGTNELIVSYDALNVTFPNRKDKARKPSWEHVDQSPLRRGLHCVQGIINLSPAGPEDGGLTLYPRSHDLLEDWFDNETDGSTWTKEDIFFFSKEQLKYFQERGLSPIKVCAEPGDLIVWDSRTIHYGDEPTEKSNQIRTVIYAAYTPAAWTSQEQLELKKEIFENWGCTTHWPHDNIVFRESKTFLDDGTRDPRDRDEPLEKPEMTDKLMKLAGLKPY